MLLALAFLPQQLRAQANYEIQVYGADTVPPDNLMVELHSNFTADGQKSTIDGVYPTNHQEHETLELTEGLTSWSEVGFYVFTSEQDGHGVQWVGDHIRPRVRIPESWGWPVGVSLVDRDRLPAQCLLSGHLDLGDPPDHRQGDWALVFRGESRARAHLARSGRQSRTRIRAEPQDRLRLHADHQRRYRVLRRLRPHLSHFASTHDQQQQLFFVTDLNVSPVWEINIGVGVGATASTDHLIFKAILGRRFDWGRHSPID
jgi:hypothetical protein